MSIRLRVLHLAALDATDAEVRDSITREIDTYLVPCAILRRCTKQGEHHTTTSKDAFVTFTCMCPEYDASHAIHVRNTSRGFVAHKHPVQLPMRCLFLLPQDELQYRNLPDLGIFIRATMTKRFFSASAMAQHAKMRNLFVSGNKRGVRKKMPIQPDILGKGWMQVISNSWSTPTTRINPETNP
jgi:hypothetical protein